MTSVEGKLNSSGLPLFHLRRVGPPPSKDGVVSVMDLYRITYMIGRSAVLVDFYIDSSNHIQSASISGCHARIVRQNGNQHRLYDDSLNGVFVNNMKIAGSCVLREGDKVTFGHPCGARLPAGSRSRQPDSEHQFMFEMCSCDNSKSNRNGARGNTNQETLCFKKPVSPDEARGSKMSSRTKKTVMKTTQCFTQDDVRKLKQAWEERQSDNVIVNGRREEYISDLRSQNADIRPETSHSAEENYYMISSQNTLQKLKTGMKEFFKLWSKKSNNMTETGSTEKGYIYIQDNVGQYKLLELEVPEKSLLNMLYKN